MAAYALFALLPIMAGIGILVAKYMDQRARDTNRKTYRLAFPANLDAERITAWVRSISGSLRGSASSLTGAPAITFEVLSTNAGFIHRIRVPWQDADYLIAQLRSLIPGMRVTPEDDYESFPNWTKAFELGLSNTARQLRIFNPADTAGTLLASMQSLAENESVLIQWVVTPAVPAPLPIYRKSRTVETHAGVFLNGDLADRDEINDRREKLQEPNVMAVLRVASKAESKARADHLLYRVRAALSSARGPSTRFTKRFVSQKQLAGRVSAGAGSVIFPIRLSATELTALIAWPIGNPFISGLPPVMSRHLPASEIVPRVGRIIGRSNMPGNERPIAIAYEEARKHMHIAGPTGVGKTALLANLMKQDMEHGYGVVLIENKGDLFNSALDYVPPDRIKDVVVLDVNDTTRPVGFNILRQGDPHVIVDEITNLFEHLYADAHGVWTRQILYHGLHTIATRPELTFIDLAALLVPMSSAEGAWRDGLIRGVQDPELRQFWQRFDNQPRTVQDRITQPVMDRIWQLNARSEIRNIIGQSASSFQMSDIIRDNKILMVNLAGLASDTASLTGTLIMNALWHAVKSTRSDRPTYLYLDEFQDFLNLPVDPEDMLAKARGFGLGMTLAHQHLAQLPNEMRQAVMANARTKVIFQTSADDARAMTREFGSSVTEQDFMSLGNYEAIARIATDRGVSAPLTLTTNEPARGYGKAKQVKIVSGQSYGRKASDVEASITARRNVAAAPSKKRPKLGGEGWG